jgi:hypothetical protein
MPSKLITAKQKYEKEKERQRNSKAQSYLEASELKYCLSI